MITILEMMRIIKFLISVEEIISQDDEEKILIFLLCILMMRIIKFLIWWESLNINIKNLIILSSSSWISYIFLFINIIYIIFISININIFVMYSDIFLRSLTISEKVGLFSDSCDQHFSFNSIMDSWIELLIINLIVIFLKKSAIFGNKKLSMNVNMTCLMQFLVYLLTSLYPPRMEFCSLFFHNPKDLQVIHFVNIRLQ